MTHTESLCALAYQIFTETSKIRYQKFAFGDYGLPSASRGSDMRTETRAGFDPAALKRLYGAFDAAWDQVKDSTSDADRESVREVLGKTIFSLARHGYSNADHLAAFAAYRGKVFIDLRC